MDHAELLAEVDRRIAKSEERCDEQFAQLGERVTGLENAWAAEHAVAGERHNTLLRAVETIGRKVDENGKEAAAATTSIDSLRSQNAEQFATIRTVGERLAILEEKPGAETVLARELAKQPGGISGLEDGPPSPQEYRNGEAPAPLSKAAGRALNSPRVLLTIGGLVIGFVVVLSLLGFDEQIAHAIDALVGHEPAGE